MDSPRKIVVASSDFVTQQRLAGILYNLGLGAIYAPTVDHCRLILGNADSGLIFCDRRLCDGDYRDVLAATFCQSPIGKIRIVLMSSVVGMEEYEDAKRAGLFNVIPSPCRPTDVRWMVNLTDREERKRAKHVGGGPLNMNHKAPANPARPLQLFSL